jgi:hypothetical protein
MSSLNTIDYDALRDEIRSLVQFSEQRYFTNVSWEVTQHPTKASMFENNEFRPLTDEEWNEVHHTDCNTAYLIVPLSRFSEVTEVIPIGRELSAKNVITKIHEFYHTPLSDEKIQDISSFPNDFLGYNSDTVAQATNGEVVYYVDLRGSAIFFEGIQRVSGNVYKLNFGS